MQKEIKQKPIVTRLKQRILKDFEHGSYIYANHLNQNGGLVIDICATLTTLDCGHVIVEE
jgi:hypothetical protein